MVGLEDHLVDDVQRYLEVHDINSHRLQELRNSGLQVLFYHYDVVFVCGLSQNLYHLNHDLKLLGQQILPLQLLQTLKQGEDPFNKPSYYEKSMAFTGETQKEDNDVGELG